ncbi:unnamed protein product [Allacma fusca]|uniref:Uncharacterized protein n=1 Tax=Allacma fusca TaxID=39272 RepID=A0A8J2NRD5_9HEXA|nr:unnamed protein product [Allacma fusca]
MLVFKNILILRILQIVIINRKQDIVMLHSFVEYHNLQSQQFQELLEPHIMKEEIGGFVCNFLSSGCFNGFGIGNTALIFSKIWFLAISVLKAFLKQAYKALTSFPNMLRKKENKTVS